MSLPHGMTEDRLTHITAHRAKGPVVVDGEERFGESEIEMARAGFALLESGFPLQTLLDAGLQFETPTGGGPLQRCLHPSAGRTHE